MEQHHKTTAVNALKKQFDRAVNIRKWSMVRERIVPRVMPPLVLGTAFTTTLFFNLWQHLPPQGRMAGMIAFAGALALSPFLNKVGSPLVTRKDALRAIDSDINDPHHEPAREFADVLSKEDADHKSLIWAAQKQKIWDRWSEQFTDQHRKTGFGAYYYGENKNRAPIHMAIVFTAACLYPVLGGNLEQGWSTATDWTVPPPPLVYSATITPPERIEGEQVFTDLMIKAAIEGNQTITPHERSTLSIITYDRPAHITLNGTPLTPLPPQDIAERVRTTGGNIFVYQTELGTDSQTVTIDDFTVTLDIKEDNAPRVRVHSAAPDRNDPTSLRLDYSITDDYGAIGADAEIGIRGSDGQTIPPVMESNQLPTLTLPYR